MWYIDTSAFLKLIVLEDESAALRDWFVEQSSIWSSQLLQTEVLRAGDRLEVPRETVESALATISMVLPATNTFFVAARLLPSALSSLDALHLASALELGADLEGLVTYDERMTQGAQSLSLSVLAPR
jgi:predicted nucleic acid-binding protein